MPTFLSIYMTNLIPIFHYLITPFLKNLIDYVPTRQPDKASKRLFGYFILIFFNPDQISFNTLFPKLPPKFFPSFSSCSVAAINFLVSLSLSRRLLCMYSCCYFNLLEFINHIVLSTIIIPRISSHL